VLDFEFVIVAHAYAVNPKRAEGLGFVGAAPNPVSTSEFMRILLQHVRTQLYLRSLGNWTVSPLEAFDFRLSQSAIEFAREHDLPGVQIVIKVNGHEYEEVFPLPMRTTSPAHRARDGFQKKLPDSTARSA
jgi:hypothetical protein